MIYSYTNNEQSVASNGNILFVNDAIKTGTTVVHTPGTATFQLVRSGFYYITLTATGVLTATGTDPITISLYNGSTPIGGATTSAAATEDGPADLTINAIVRVAPSCCVIDNNINLIAVNEGAAATFSNTTITITKIA